MEGPDPGDARGRRPKSLTRWLRANLLANGIFQELPLGTQLDIAEVLVWTGRAIPMAQWVTSIARQGSEKALEALI